MDMYIMQIPHHIHLRSAQKL
jgi:hypothetical protein